jgi:hypothetical protein
MRKARLISLLLALSVLNVSLPLTRKQQCPSVVNLLPVAELAADDYIPIRNPLDLPWSVQKGLACELGQQRLHMASAGRPFNSTDYVADRSLPWHRLIAAGVGERYVVVHFEEGGYSPSWRIAVFERTAWSTRFLWSGHADITYRKSDDFLQAIHSGALCPNAQRAPSNKALQLTKPAQAMELCS